MPTLKWCLTCLDLDSDANWQASEHTSGFRTRGLRRPFFLRW